MAVSVGDLKSVYILDKIINDNPYIMWGTN
jgi:hypothetical protein